MRHHRFTVRFGRQRSHYYATLRALVIGLLKCKSIRTTKVKAKQASRLADRLITLGKDKTIANQRKAYSILRDRKLVAVLFNELAPLFKKREGGYTRVLLLGERHGDNAQMALLEFVEKPKVEPAVKVKSKKEAILDKSKVEEAGIDIKEVKKTETRDKKEEIKGDTEEQKKEKPMPKEPKKSVVPKQKPGFFKKFFVRKQDR